MKIPTASNRIQFGLATALTVAIMAVSRPPTAHAQNLHGTITNVASSKCLQPDGGSTTAGAAIVQQPCSSSAGAAQLWTVVPYKSGYYHYVNQLSGMCMDARGGAQNHTAVQQWPCNTITNEFWLYSPLPGKTVVFLYSGVAGSSRKFCLDVPGAQTTAGLALQIYACNGSVAQQYY